ncbi:type II secretion system protein [Beggiatoa leptomitoformis]|uniref:Prepilin-type N-terminal cleavage/methylation domain-containing protein n=1 Tax=Beggiatoa leptomitoformis TaxID=288004 RepID=A0A2N9YAB7_9GAMM|nr:type II secretion system protein [Beggiatoa leptomitoformis]ALG67206.1 hypothetical protein AL038_05140 [Beggiatoa leptomitoformis]AUI67384.1 hypothetical protein BLE401_00850 [Beggiatoa leptomitoformis]
MVQNKERGFSILELAMVVFIIALLAGSLLIPLSTRINQQYIQNTQKSLEEAKEALLGYAVINGRFPCPALADGKANSTLCNSEGFIPWVELGVGRYDGWGKTLRYRVDKTFMIDEAEIKDKQMKGTSGFTIKTIDNSSLASSDVIVAILFSTGKNGKADNTNLIGGSNTNYTQDTQNSAQNFDDMLIWISNSMLASRWVMSGRTITD